MCSHIFSCFQQYKHFSNIISTRIIALLQNYCNTINPSDNNDVWKPTINNELFYSISNSLKQVLKKNKIHLHNIDEGFTHYAATQIAYYIFNKIVDNNVVEFKLHAISLDDNIINYELPKINNTTMKKFKNEFCNIHGSPVDLNTTFVIDKFVIETKFYNIITTTIDKIDYNTILMACYNEFTNLINKPTHNTHPLTPTPTLISI